MTAPVFDPGAAEAMLSVMEREARQQPFWAEYDVAIGTLRVTQDPAARSKRYKDGALWEFWYAWGDRYLQRDEALGVIQGIAPKPTETAEETLARLRANEAVS
jgi:hypothetical protein